MRVATLYNVQSIKVPVVLGDAVRVHEFKSPYLFRFRDGLIDNEVVKQHRLDVHEIRRIDGSSDLICLSPELEEILMIPLKAKTDAKIEAMVKAKTDAKIEAMLKDLAQANRVASNALLDVNRVRIRYRDLESHLTKFNMLPWYKRVWVALRGGV